MSLSEQDRIDQQEMYERRHPELERYRVGNLRGFAICGICHHPEAVDANGEFRRPCPRRREATCQAS